MQFATVLSTIVRQVKQDTVESSHTACLAVQEYTVRSGIVDVVVVADKAIINVAHIQLPNTELRLSLKSRQAKQKRHGTAHSNSRKYNKALNVS